MSTIVSSIAPVSASNVSAPETAIDFSTTVAGKTYDAAVTYASGQYVARDPGFLGAEATGTSVQTAEENLINRIDFLV
jgi:hypothetical protein